MKKYKNWVPLLYRFSHDTNKDYSCKELKNYFFIDGSEVIYCKKDFGMCKAGNYYMVSAFGQIQPGFDVNDWTPIPFYLDKEYMKHKKIAE